ncbi:UDP-N-acetylmuramoyl-tripeptide--D-alanyl-D-alanine ligase [Flavobacteriaceae bacterium]|uniref:UDP-N-acetylmuramoyl-tripeptide--D-alanyl-D- alanine ligase n=1 Tax=Candidatus Arcticimaribacter forsetii TaxID=2820661 RepID=UPI0020776678|nr:UDP-N-acetylmuramoyl-tripeptide--D-alanyl-D-alanine ligase [Candidatus Arcticimaribacter forsetii]MDA8639466.1 UDP-N-acetylmuramoyl-tripeptide--D-alanyl-D-alanine ligase [Flavobacteriaceae bacterium]MDA8698771.1 UDP-N-acetylmuramoyl-tripeptide--D-alanyl-D-alanine ligase [Flavobacteriaceae bacterium]MDB2325738.1 UDP-N-acetylmuramoyl-tripeptide--D-alanyl-D-alanine ligase [Flavobacteriaceae bacterium]MDB4620985.1 UDP-N-acetylmuramoyl-tripeptide--D-alanyl-D-alanine ligase [Flavobacteriaceae bact
MEAKTLYSYFLKSSSVITDTRKIEKNALFFCLRGENFNGNKFAKEALQKGAAFVVIDDSEYFKENSQYILVEDCLKSLQELAKYHRLQFDIPVIGLTGSNGKTTTKELIYSVLSEQFNTTATFGNLNNHIGVPLTLLRINKNTEIALIEMGANHLKEIEFLCNITKPTHGYITNFGKAHLEGFGSIEGVIQGKSELYKSLENTKGTALINSEDKLQVRLTKNQAKQQFGNKEADIVITSNNYTTKDNNYLSVSFQSTIINSKLKGTYNYSNIKAAIAFGFIFDISLEKIKKGIEGYIPKNNRSQWLKTERNTVILDAYNANPSSMTVALESLLNSNTKNKILILGDMLELGDYAADEHQKIIEILNKKTPETVILVGKEFKKTKTSNSNFHKFEETKDVIPFLQKKNFQNKTILIKGSRGIALEVLQEYL